MLNAIVYPIVSIGGLALAFGAILGFSAKKFAVKVDPLVEKILDALPGANCGGCGYPGCAVFAENVAKGTAAYNGCSAAGAAGAEKIASFIGIKAVSVGKKVAFVKCNGTDDKTTRNYIYDGPKSCVAASQLATGGNKACAYSCIGHGSCKHVCPFGAIEMSDGVAVVNADKCTGCGKCVAVCPKGVIELAPIDCKPRVLCNSKDKGAVVRKNCIAGCIACRICQNVCSTGAIVVENNVAHIDYEKCTSCLECVKKCPRKAISEIR